MTENKINVNINLTLKLSKQNIEEIRERIRKVLEENYPIKLGKNDVLTIDMGLDSE